MKILILEDSKERIKTFKKNFKKHDLYFFDNVEDAKKAFDLLSPFDMIFLDHDLDDKIYVNSNEENTGYQMAKYIALKGFDGDIITHTLNRPGAENIIGVLPKARHVPFINLFK